MTEEERKRRVAVLLVGLYDLALECGFEWDGERWWSPVEISTLRAGPGETGRGSGTPIPPSWTAVAVASGSVRSVEVGVGSRE